MSAAASTAHWAAQRRPPVRRRDSLRRRRPRGCFIAPTLGSPFLGRRSHRRLLLTLWVQDGVNEGSDRPSDERSDDEYPQLAESVASDEERRTDAPSGIDRGPVDRDADEMDKRESQADDEAGNQCVACTSRYGKDHEHEQEREDDFGHKRAAALAWMIE